MVSLKPASLGAISSGTLRNEDLLESFADELEYQVQRNAAAWCSDGGRATRDKYLTLVNDARETDSESNDAGDIISELQDALESFAPPFAYFGAADGDGACFGFWPCDMSDFDGPIVDDSRNGRQDEIPNDYVGYSLHVSDHGNMTLYEHFGADKPRIEVWGIV